MKLFIFLFFSSLVSSLALPQNDDGSTEGPLIGDLLTGITTPVGQSIANILLGVESAQSGTTGTPPIPNPNKRSCKTSSDVCCVWYAISADLSRDFRGPTGRCNDMARAAIRLGFHDAGTWSQKLAAAGQDFGGADGSFVLFNEILRKENRGLELITIMAIAYKVKCGVRMGDLIQYMATHAVVTCPLGPRIRYFAGRKVRSSFPGFLCVACRVPLLTGAHEQDATRASPEGLLPSVSAPADQLIALFADKTISPHELTALVGAHSTSKQFAQDITQFAKAQDTTPGVWDVSFYNETIQPKPSPKVFRFASDTVISKDPRCSVEWNAFIGDQAHWNDDYARAYTRLSLLGVNNINNLTECTGTLPAARPSFPGSTEAGVDQ